MCYKKHLAYTPALVFIAAMHRISFAKKLFLDSHGRFFGDYATMKVLGWRDNDITQKNYDMLSTLKVGRFFTFASINRHKKVATSIKYNSDLSTLIHKIIGANRV